jgi:hypothetical protein
MQYTGDIIERMSSTQYVEYLERLFPFTAAGEPLLKNRPLDVISLMMDAARAGAGGEEVVDLITSATSPSALADIFKSKLRAIGNSLEIEAANPISNIPITCIPKLRRPNAESAITPRGDPYILIDAGLAIYLHGMTKALFHCIKLQPEQSADIPLGRGELLGYLHKMARCFEAGDPGNMPHIPSRKTTSVVMLQTLIVHGLETFLICHELAHYLLGHLNEHVKDVVIDTAPPLNVRLVSRERKEEFLADHFGAGFAYQTFEFYIDEKKALQAKVPPTYAPEIYAAPDIFFTFLDVLERIRGDTSSSVNTHPPASSRRAMLRQEYNKKIPDNVIQFGQMVEDIFMDLVP